MLKIKKLSLEGVKSVKSNKKTNMDKVKIKRVKRNKKKITTAEKILAGVGVGSTLLGGASSIAPKTNQTQFVRTQGDDKSSKAGNIKNQLKNIFSSAYQNTLGVLQAKADFSEGDASSVTSGVARGDNIIENSDSNPISTTPIVLADDSMAVEIASSGGAIKTEPVIAGIDLVDNALIDTGAVKQVVTDSGGGNNDTAVIGKDLTATVVVGDIAEPLVKLEGGPAIKDSDNGGTPIITNKGGGINDQAEKVLTEDAIALNAGNLNSTTYSASLNGQIDSLHLTAAQIAAATAGGVVPGSVLAFMLGLGNDRPAGGTQNGVYTFNGTTWVDLVSIVTGGGGTGASSVTIGATVTAQTGPQGNYTTGTVNGQSVALLDGKIYDNTGKDITSTFSASDLAKIQTALATPTTGVGAGGQGAAVTLTPTNLNSTTYSASLNGQIDSLHLTAAQIAAATAGGVVPGSVLAFMLGLGNDRPAGGTQNGVYTFNGTTWVDLVSIVTGGGGTGASSVTIGATVTAQTGPQGNYTTGTVNGQSVALLDGKIYDNTGKDITSTFSASDLAKIQTALATPTTGVGAGGQGAAVTLTPTNLNSTTYSASLNGQIDSLHLTAAQIAAATAGGVVPGSVLAFMLGLGNDRPASGTVRSGFTFNGGTWTKVTAGAVTLTSANINSTPYDPSLNSQISALKITSYSGSVTPGSVLAYILGLGDGSSGSTTRLGSDGNTYALQHTGAGSANMWVKQVNSISGINDFNKTAAGTLSFIVSSGNINKTVVGDTWQINITGAVANTPVFVSGLQPNGTLSTVQMGTTDAKGNFSLSGTFTKDQIGSWSEAWSVGSNAVGSFSFKVTDVKASAVGSFSGTTSSGKSISNGDLLSLSGPESFTINIKGAAANQDVVVFAGKNGTVLIANQTVGKTDVNGNFTYSGSLTSGGTNYVFAVGDTKVGAFGANVAGNTAVPKPLTVEDVKVKTPSISSLKIGDIPTNVASGSTLKIGDITPVAVLKVGDIPKDVTSTILNVNDIPKDVTVQTTSLNINDIPNNTANQTANTPLQVSAVQSANNFGGIPFSISSGGASSGSSSGGLQVSTLGGAVSLATGFQGPSGLQMPTGLQMPSGYSDSKVAVAATPSSQTYVVKKGDTLWSIAKKYYGDGKQWRKILDANTKSLSTAGNTKTLRVGFQLVIPGK
jgi:LysM repeat protein